MPRSTVPRRWLPMIGLAVTILIWSSNNIVSKVIMRETTPMALALLRFSLAGLLFYVPVFIVMHRGPQRFTRAEWPRIILLGTVGTTGSLVLYLLGLKTTPASEAGIYQITTPLFVVVIAWLWLGERLSRARLAGVVIAALGAVILVTGGGAVGLGQGDVVGAVLILSSNLTWAGYTLLSKDLLARRSPLLLLAAANLVGAVVIWSVAALLGSLPELQTVVSLSPTAWLIMLYLIAFMSTTSQWLYFRCLREVKASQASTFIYLTPFFTVILAAIFLGEIPTPAALVAGLLILIGVWMVNRPQHRRRPELVVSPQVPRPDSGMLAEKEPARNPISSGGQNQS